MKECLAIKQPVMAAIDLERGLEHSGCGWGQERPELMDNFDSEMQEWEDQLQDIQRKIEEVRRYINNAGLLNVQTVYKIWQLACGHAF